MGSDLYPTTWRFDVANTAVLVPTFVEIVVTDAEGNPVFDRVPFLDGDDNIVIGENGFPIMVDGPQATNQVQVLDGESQPILETVYRDLTFFVRKPDISEQEARQAFDGYTAGRHPNAVQSAYEPDEAQWAEDWNAGLGTFIDL